MQRLVGQPCVGSLSNLLRGCLTGADAARRLQCSTVAARAADGNAWARRCAARFVVPVCRCGLRSKRERTFTGPEGYCIAYRLPWSFGKRAGFSYASAVKTLANWAVDRRWRPRYASTHAVLVGCLALLRRSHRSKQLCHAADSLRAAWHIHPPYELVTGRGRRAFKPPAVRA